jgi:hypothetical protein
MRGPHAPRCAAQCLAHASPSGRRRREGDGAAGGARGRRRVCERLVGGFGRDVLGFGPVAAGLLTNKVIFLNGSMLTLCEYVRALVLLFGDISGDKTQET